MSVERIEAAAIKHKDGTVYSVPQPGRHNDVIHLMAQVHKLPTPITGEQGFTTTSGRFVDRVEGAQIAIAARQVRLHPRIGLNHRLNEHGLNFHGKELFSEDMW